MNSEVASALEYVGRHARALAWTAVAGASLASINASTDTRVEAVEKTIVEYPAHKINQRLFWEKKPDQAAAVTNIESGKVVVNSFRGAFTTYTEARATINGKLFGQTYDTSKTTMAGYVVSRIKMDGLNPALELDTRSSNGATLFTRFVNGQRVGIDITNATFEMMDPEQADEVNGALQCTKQPEDSGFHGCIPKQTIRNGFFSSFPIIGEDQKNDIANAGAILFDEYAKIERCHFDSIIIPEMNKVLEGLANRGINLRIDGPNRYQDAMAILIRGQIRDDIKDSRSPQSVRIDIVGNFVPLESVNVRLQKLDDTVNFPFAPPQDFTKDYCAKGPNGVLPIGFTGKSLDSFLIQLDHYVIMGLDKVPDNYSPFTKSFVTNGDFKAPSEDTFNALAA